LPQYDIDEQKDKTERSRELWRRWRDARIEWDAEARDSIDFVLGNHYTEAESDALQAV